MAGSDFLAEDFRSTPYWWDGTPRPDPATPKLPGTVDVAVIGSGYTGLAAALHTARGGRSTLVLEAGDVGSGCSTRNGGQISTSVKPSLDALTRRHGAEKARAILAEGRNALQWIGKFIAAENIDCGFGVVGRFHAAHNEGAFRRLSGSLAGEPAGFETGGFVVPRAQQRSELGTDAYFGGVVYPRHAALDPARFHQGLLDRALAAGTQVAANCPVTGIERDGRTFRVTTPAGIVRARDVVVGTNGYTGLVTRWQRRRVIPIGSYIIATEPLPPLLVDRLFPTNRVISDTRMVVYYYRTSPDRRRILFGGRVSHSETDPVKSAPLLRAELVRLFPELSEVRISHSWMGFVAYTFDTIAHVGKHDGLHYAMGYCGSGVSMASYLGMRAGQQVLGLPEGKTGFDELPFPTRPFYSGRPWFLGMALRYYRWRDSR